MSCEKEVCLTTHNLQLTTLMLLAFDIGNTNIVAAVHDGEQWRGQWRIATQRERTADEYGFDGRTGFRRGLGRRGLEDFGRADCQCFFTAGCS